MNEVYPVDPRELTPRCLQFAFDKRSVESQFGLRATDLFVASALNLPLHGLEAALNSVDSCRL